MVDYNNLLMISKNILRDKKKTLSFIELWKQVCKEANINSNLSNDIAADFYQHLIESNFFFFDTKTKQWGLRENIKYEAFQKISDTLQSNANNDLKEKDYKNDMSDVEINELENGTRNDKTALLDLKDKNDDDIDDELDDSELEGE